MSAKHAGWLLLLGGCGSLADGSYLGEPLMSLSGTVITESLDRSFNDETIGVAMLWTLNLDGGDAAQSAVVRTEFPARYTLDIFQPPPQGNRIELFGEPDFLGVVGMPVIYADVNDDGVWNPDSEEVIGGSYTTGVLFSESIPDWFAQLAGDRAKNGFAPVQLDRDPCIGGSSGESDALQSLELDEPGESDLYVGYIAAVLWDWNCDGSDEEWSEDDWDNVENCPSFDVIERECDELNLNVGQAQDLSGQAAVEEYLRLQGILRQDAIWTSCLAEYCPEVIQGIEDGV
jgi:hypothetical protein